MATIHGERFLRHSPALSGFILAIVALACSGDCGIGRAIRADDGDKKKPTDSDLALRPYRNGPLTAADYRCPPPNPLPQKNGVYLSAMTYTSLRYGSRYRWYDAPSGKIEARLIHFEIVAEVNRRQSWNSRPTDERLLDHEQGHFDVTEMWGRQIQKKFNDWIAKGTIVGTGDDKAAAIADLNQQVDRRVQELLDQEHKAQDQYDIATRHGTNHKAQAEERQKQIAALHGKATAPAKDSGQ